MPAPLRRSRFGALVRSLGADRANRLTSVKSDDARVSYKAVSVATHFHEALGITGIVLTKLDGDARGGAALSVSSITGKPIIFASTGEGMDAFEPFHPDRMASRILDMGDILTLIEQTQKNFDEAEARAMAEKLANEQMDEADRYATEVCVGLLGGPPAPPEITMTGGQVW